MKKVKNFSLPEILVVVVALGIIALIILLNIKDLREEASINAFKAEGSIMQTVSDKYLLDNKKYPTVEQPKVTIPTNIDFGMLVTGDVKKNPPKDRRYKYWVDFNGKVWFCTIDSPVNARIEQVPGGKVFKWEKVEGAIYYDIYKVVKSKTTYLARLSSEETEFKITDVDTTVDYLVASIDKYDLECAPVGEGYGGYVDTTPEVNHPPVAVLTVTPEDNIRNNEVITFDSSKSYDPDNDAIVEKEWKASWTNDFDGAEVTLGEGTYTVELRVKDSEGNWSEWVKKEFTVTAANKENQAPIAVITMTSAGNSFDYSGLNNEANGSFNATSTFTWASDKSLDPDTKDTIVDEEWENQKASYETGTHTVRLRVQDNNGLWSEWSEVTFTIGNRKPIAQLMSIITDYSNGSFQAQVGDFVPLVYSYAGQNFTYDPDGDAITEVSLRGSFTTTRLKYSDIGGPKEGDFYLTFNQFNSVLNGQPFQPGEGFVFWPKQAGQYLLEWKVKDANGAWSEPFTVLINVTDPTNNKPVAVINQNHSVTDTDTMAVFAWMNSYDPDGDALVNVEFEMYEGGSITGDMFNFSPYIVGQDSNGVGIRFPRPNKYLILMRVQDEHGAWSDYALTEITITDVVARVISGLKLTTIGNAGAPLSYWDTHAKWFANTQSMQDLMACTTRCSHLVVPPLTWQQEEARQYLKNNLPRRQVWTYEPHKVWDDGYYFSSTNSEIYRYVNQVAKISRPPYPVLISGFYAEGTVKNPDGSIAPNVTVKLSVDNYTITQTVTSDANGYFKFTISGNQIPQKTIVSHMAWGNYSNHWYDQITVRATSGKGQQSAIGLLRTFSYSGINVFANRWYRIDHSTSDSETEDERVWFETANAGIDFMID